MTYTEVLWVISVLANFHNLSFIQKRDLEWVTSSLCKVMSEFTRKPIRNSPVVKHSKVYLPLYMKNKLLPAKLLQGGGVQMRFVESGNSKVVLGSKDQFWGGPFLGSRDNIMIGCLGDFELGDRRIRAGQEWSQIEKQFDLA